MAQSRPVTVALDSGFLIAVAKDGRRVDALLRKMRSEKVRIVVPSPVLAETTRNAFVDAPIYQFLKTIDSIFPVDAAVAFDAGRRLGRAKLPATCTLDALIVATAVAARATIIVTSDPGDIKALALDDLTVIAI